MTNKLENIIYYEKENVYTTNCRDRASEIIFARISGQSHWSAY